VALELIAPAKLNLVLEVTGRRPDGYHEIASVMQTIDLADTVRLEAAASIEIEVMGEELLGVPREGPRNLAYAAAHALAEAAGSTDLGVRIELEKRIPAGMGLGGGSSDAAAVLRGLNRLWELDLAAETLAEVAASVGSDVAFFLQGGAAFASGRGEQVEALPDVRPMQLTVFVSELELEDKTRRMYGLLSPADFTDGHRAHVAAESIRRGVPLAETDLYNAFDRHIVEVAPPLAGALALCRSAGLAVLAAGSGPGFFCPTPLAEIPELLLHELQRDWGVRAMACRSLSRAEATAMREV
jgi:4-diphosphocytidyl-2-C-methyl-D-erythritol kinase